MNVLIHESQYIIKELLGNLISGWGELTELVTVKVVEASALKLSTSMKQYYRLLE
jgi:hypothetical protein